MGRHDPQRAFAAALVSESVGVAEAFGRIVSSSELWPRGVGQVVRPMRFVTLTTKKWSTVECCCNGSTESFHSISENFNEQEFRDERARVVPSVEAAMFCSVGFRESTKQGFWVENTSTNSFRFLKHNPSTTVFFVACCISL